MLHTHKPKFNLETCKKWFTNLQSANIILVENKQVRLVPPFEIELPSDKANEITATYLDDEETGGLMLCQIKIVGDSLKFIVRHHHQIPNAVEKYFPNSSRKNSYFAEPDAYLAVLSENFSNADERDILFPIHYHTHPTADIKEDIRYITTSIKLELSDGDKDVVDVRSIVFGNYSLLYLNAILTGNSFEHRILFYGKGISPLDFNNSKAKQSVMGAIEVTKDIDDDFLKLMARIGLVVGAGIVAFNAPQQFLQLTDTFADFASKKEYFGVIDKWSNTVITLPDYIHSQE